MSFRHPAQARTSAAALNTEPKNVVRVAPNCETIFHASVTMSFGYPRPSGTSTHEHNKDPKTQFGCPLFADTGCAQ